MSDIGTAVSLVGQIRKRCCEVDADVLVAEGNNRYPDLPGGYAYATGYLQARLETVDNELERLWLLLVRIERDLMPPENESEVEW